MVQTACYLQSLGYSVTYVQFNGKHVVPPEIASDTVQWFKGNFSGAGTVPAGICST